jgi:7-cyano-7-deazaguanine synthase
VADHVIVDLDFRPFAKASSLTNSDLAVPTTARDGIPNTYVPARNTIFLSYALAYAESVGARDIFIGANAIDYSGYPDCRPEYLQAFECLANLATRAGVEGQNLRRAVGARESPPLRIHAPLLPMGKAQIVRYGIELGVNFGETHSCYDPVLAASLTSLRGSRALACGECDSCRIRLAGFAAAGISDPVPYVDARSSQSP